MTAGVHVVLVHHDQPDLCARSVDAFRAQAGVREVTVVDSGSTPTARGRLRELRPGLVVVDAGANVADPRKGDGLGCVGSEVDEQGVT
ncbi:hypothetical protein GHK86_21745, partial [Acidimicrobiaceae bacterium USS-CC1]|nr:hypothetical protein [Acidiferrimicrobium australe]